jgi:hypothetical protein
MTYHEPTSKVLNLMLLMIPKDTYKLFSDIMLKTKFTIRICDKYSILFATLNKFYFYNYLQIIQAFILRPCVINYKMFV